MTLLSWMPLGRRVLVSADDTQQAPAPATAVNRKWLPVIDTDNCLGCERCVNACEHGCLEMIWSFSTLTRPHQCSGEGHCVEACPDNVIHMAWMPLASNSELAECRNADA